MHSLLKRQFDRFFGAELALPKKWLAFIDAVNDAYRGFDTDRAMLERSLELSSQELMDANSAMRAIFKAIPDIVLRLDQAGVILDIKGSAVFSSVVARKQYIGKRIQDTPLRQAAQEFLLGIRKLSAEGGTVSFEYTTCLPGQEARYYEARLAVLPQAQALAIVRDISERKRTEAQNAALLEEIRRFNAELELRVAERTEALRQQEALFHAAAEQAPQVMWIVDAHGEVTYLNRAWYELVGGVPPMWHGHEWMQTVLPEDVAEMRRKWTAVKESGALFSGTRRVRAADGTLHTLSYRASPVHDSCGNVACWIGMDADITEIKAIEADLRASNRELEAFSYSVSHDLRAPLSAVDGFSQALAEQFDSQDRTKLNHYVSRIHCGVARMNEMINSLLVLAQVSRTKLQPRPVNLSDIATSVLEELHSRHPERNISVAVQPGLIVNGDAGMLTVAMENLLGNAWKFTSRSEAARIEVGRSSAANEAGPVFFVSDNGAGFDMQHGDRLFGTFQRLHSAEEFPGTGVGLATVQRIAARHGGRVWAEAQPGKGATFFLALPETFPVALRDEEPSGRGNDSRFGPL